MCWRQAVNSDGFTMFSTEIDTSRNYAEVGLELGFGDTYFACINRHLYNADAVFLPLSTNPDHSSEVFRILKEGIENGWQYQPAPFKTRLQYTFTKEELCNLEILMLLAWPGFKRRTFNSPLFHHMDKSTMLELWMV